VWINTPYPVSDQIIEDRVHKSTAAPAFPSIMAVMSKERLSVAG
jgi:hypothetical protein